MKKLVVSLLIMLGVSVVGASASFGYVLKNEIKTYEVSKDYPLKKEALKKVYITSNIPVRVCTTEGTPSIALDTRSLGVFAKEPHYKVDVREEGDTTYIEVNRDSVGSVGISFEAHEEAIVYLSTQDMDKLSVASTAYFNGVKLDMDETNIKSVDLDLDNGQVRLEGNYEEIKVRGGDVQIESYTPAKVLLDNTVSVDLRGQFKDIDIRNHRGGTMRVDSQIPVDIEISGEGYYGHGQDFKLKGAYKNMAIEVNGGTLGFDLTVAPERVNILGEVDTINLELPGDTPGFKVIRKNTFDDETERVSRIYSDFAGAVSDFKTNSEVMSYGDQSTRILVENYDSEILVLEGR